MTIVKARHYELDKLVRTELFISKGLAESRTATWEVTTWGMVYFDEIEVTDH
jgi:hypothetical protein